ncbi:MAG: tetratricopeptide repeat protein [Muribaculaceae bacterium]|nr:tetratricopeptide repeat protein [Bacteroidales bacterium]MDY4650304.1 tetratricopeptide repeat protein [Muribaculaceae bacterium]
MNVMYVLNIKVLALCAILVAAVATPLSAQSTRAERRHINTGNRLYEQNKFVDAQREYQAALKANPSSAVATYNLGLSQLRQIKNLKDTTSKNSPLRKEAVSNLSAVANMAASKPGLAAKANYNLGNMEFNSENYKGAIDYYKQSLRIDPSDERARKNLRIAQKKLQQQQQNQQNQDKKDQDKQDQDKKDQQQKQDQKQQKQDQKQDQEKQQQISPQTSQQILQAVDNKENAVRARVNKANSGKKSGEAARSVRRW